MDMWWWCLLGSFPLFIHFSPLIHEYLVSVDILFVFLLSSKTFCVQNSLYLHFEFISNLTNHDNIAIQKCIARNSKPFHPPRIISFLLLLISSNLDLCYKNKYLRLNIYTREELKWDAMRYMRRKYVCAVIVDVVVSAVFFFLFVVIPSWEFE